MKRKRLGAATTGARNSEESACKPKDVVKQIRLQLRKVQNITGCATSVLNLVLQHLQPFLKGCEQVKNLKMPRVRSRQETRIKCRLHGCVGCHDHVFGPSNRDAHCTKCGHDRYDAKGHANEVFCMHVFACFFFLYECMCLLAFFLAYMHVFVGIFFLNACVCMCSIAFVYFFYLLACVLLVAIFIFRSFMLAI